MSIDVFDVSKPDDGFSGKVKNVDVFDVSKPNVKRPFRKNTSCKTGCLARMMVMKIKGCVIEVYGFVEEHNHPLVSHEDMQIMISSRELGFLKQQFMLQVANSNVGPVRGFKLMKEMYGGFENVGETATDCKNFRRDLNLFIGDRDAQMVVEKLENLEKHCDDFFYGLLPRRMRFIIYKMVFIPFTGIDNHNRSVTFGAGLLSNEIVSSYKWLLQSFKKAFVADPQVVITDQDASMKQAVEAEFPNARHRLCMSHIMQKLVTKTTSRSESKNRYFNRFTNPDLTLVEFISHFEYAMDIQRYTQKKNDHESRHNRPEFRTDWQLEKDAAELFTLNIFYEIQDEIVAYIAKCLSINVEQMSRLEKYFIRDTEVKNGKIPLNLKCLRCCILHLIPYLLAHANEYVLDRWSKSDENIWVDTSADAYESSSDVAVRAIRRIFKHTVDRLVPFKDKLDLYRLELSDLLAKEEADVPVLMRVNKKDTFYLMLGVTEPDRVVIKVPSHSKNKGTGSYTRWKNMDELIQNEVESSKKRRTCFVCLKVEGHNSRTCPHKDEINAADKRTKRVTRSSSINYKE
nr:hypothetical protein [Tanacetum cinerariifolium]